MAIRNFAICAALVCAALAAAPVKAQPVTDGGCAALANAVRGAVSTALAADRGSPGVAVSAAWTSCGRTAAVASAAFGRALTGFSLSLAWPDHDAIAPGDVCLSHYLSQCYPQAAAGMPWSPRQAALVADTWQGVAAGIRRHMPFGAASDLSYFRPADLDNTLAISVAATVEDAAPRRSRAGRRARWQDR